MTHGTYDCPGLTSHQRLNKHGLQASSCSLSSGIFRCFALLLPALFRLLPHTILDRLLWVRARLFVQAILSPKGFYGTKFFCKLRQLFHACKVPFDYSWLWHTQESVVYDSHDTSGISRRCSTVHWIHRTDCSSQGACEETQVDSAIKGSNLPTMNQL